LPASERPPLQSLNIVAVRKLRILAPVLVGLALVFPAAASAQLSSRQSSDLLFDGSKKSSWLDQSAVVSRIGVVTDPATGVGKVLRFEAYNSDVFPITPTQNPRAQLVTPLPVRPGGQFWESYEVYVPKNFPVGQTYHGWIALGSPAYGAPWAGSPSVNVAITDGHFRFQRNAYADHPYQIAWQMPLVLGRWVRFTWHVLLSRQGFTQLYVNNAPVELADGSSRSTTLSMPVIDQTDGTGPWFSQLSVYFEHDVFPKLTLYFKDFRIGTTEAAAVPAP
jgi:hypothetical protein